MNEGIRNLSKLKQEALTPRRVNYLSISWIISLSIRLITDVFLLGEQITGNLNIFAFLYFSWIFCATNWRFWLKCLQNHSISVPFSSCDYKKFPFVMAFYFSVCFFIFVLSSFCFFEKLIFLSGKVFTSYLPNSNEEIWVNWLWVGNDDDFVIQWWFR